jgi:hypothetical protein
MKRENPDAARRKFRKQLTAWRNAARNASGAWIKALVSDPMRGLEWSKDGVKATVRADVLSYVLQGFDGPATLEQIVAFAQAEVRRLGGHPDSSTALLDAPLRAYRIAAWIEVLDVLEGRR